MTILDPRVTAYTNLFKSQMSGAAIAVYQILHSYQSWKGFRDFFPGLLRRILPIPLNVGKSAVSEMSDAQDHGASFKDTLKSALRPTTKAEIQGALSQIDQAKQASGHKHDGKH